jgi:peptidyl-prolyl cis-trans isomerase C
MRSFLCLLAVVALAACPGPGDQKKPKKPKTGAVVAVVGGEDLTVDELQQKLAEQSPFVRARYADPEKKKELLDAQVRFEVLAKEAEARGFADDPEVQEAVKKIIVQKLTREEFDGRVQLKDITDAELQAYFEAHEADYQKPEMVRASVVVIPFGGAAEKAAAQKKADDVQKQAADPKKKDDRNYWKDLVTQHSSDEATKPAGGDLRYL